MTFEEFVKLTMANRQISTKEIAPILGLTEPSFRNKLSKGNLNLRDVLIISLVFNLNLSLCDYSGKPVYTFHIDDYVNDDELEPLKQYRQKHMDDKGLQQWFNGLPEETKMTLFDIVQANLIPKTTKKKGKKLIDFIPSGKAISIVKGKHKRYMFTGENQEKALEYIVNRINDVKDEKEEKQIIDEAIKLFGITLTNL